MILYMYKLMHHYIQDNTKLQMTNIISNWVKESFNEEHEHFPAYSCFVA